MSRTLVFPGQGIANFSFLSRLIKAEPSFSKHFDLIDETLQCNFSHHLLSDDASSHFFHKTSNAQPAIVASSFLINQFLISQKGTGLLNQANYVIGHSLGEFTSLLFNDALSLQDTIKLVHKRGILMEKCVDKYYKDSQTDSSQDSFKMTSIFLSPDKFDRTLEFLTQNELQRPVYLSNINSKKQIVIVGLQSLIAETLKELKMKTGMRFRVKDLPVEIPFHSQFLQEAQLELHELVNSDQIQFKNETLTKPIVTNFRFTEITSTKKAVDFIINNTTKVVDFVGLVEHLHNEKNVKEFLCIGPGTINKLIEVAKSTNGWDDVDSQLFSVD